MALSGSSSGRNIVVTVTSNTAQFAAGMAQVRSQLTGLQSQMSSMFSTMGAGISSVSNQLILVGAAGTGFSQYLTRMFSDSLPVVEEYYQAQARLISLIDDGTKSYQQMSNEVWAFAKAQSESSIFTATEVTKAMYIVAQAGYENNDILKVATATMNLATAQAYDFTQTTDDVIGILNAFKLEASDADRIVNLLAATLTASKMSMEDITYGAKYASVAFNAMGYSAEQAFTAMSLLTDLGYRGENAGRILRDSLADLMDPTAEAMEIINKHHIVLYKNQSEYDALVATYNSVSASVTSLKEQEEMLSVTMREQQRYTENLNLEMQKMNLEQQKIRLKYNEDNPMLKSLEHEKEVLVDSRDAAKDYYNQLKAEQRERLSHITGQRDTVSEIRREITAINNEMAYNRAEGYTSESPRQIGLAEQKKFLQDQLAEESKNLDTMRSDYNKNKNTIDIQRQKVTESNEKIADQNKSIKKIKEDLADAEQKEINEIERKKIKIEEEKIAQAEKYQLLQDQQQKVNDQLDEYNKKVDDAQRAMKDFVPTGLIEYEQLLKNINAAKLQQGEMYVIFGKQSAPGMSDLTSDKTLAKWDERIGKLLAGEKNQEALRQKESVVGSLYGQETIAKTKYDNTTLQAVQNKYEPLLAVIKAMSDPQLIEDITTIKSDMLGGVIEGVGKLIPTVHNLVGAIAGSGAGTLGAIGAMTAMTGVIMYAVTPALLTLGVFGSMAGLSLRGLGTLFGMGGGGAATAVARGVGGAGKNGALETELRNLIAILTPAKVEDVTEDIVDMTRRGKYSYSTTAKPIKYDTRTEHEKFGDMLIRRAGLNNYGDLGYKIYYREHDKDSLGRTMPLRDANGKFVSAANEQAELASRIPQMRGPAAYTYNLDGIDPLLYTRRPLIQKSSKNAIDPALLKQLDALEDKLKKTGSVKTLASGLDDVAIASTKAAPATGGLVAKFAGLFAPVTSLIPFIGGGASAGLAAGIGETAVAAPVATGLLGGLGTTIAALAVPIAIIIAIIGALYLAWHFNLFNIQETTKNVVESIGKHFGWIVEWATGVKDEFMKTFGSMLEGLQEVWDGLANADLTQLIEGLGKIAGTFLRFGGQVLWYAAEFITGFFASIINGVIDDGPGALEAFGAFLSDIPGLLMSAGQVIIYQAANFGASLVRAFLGIDVSEAELQEQHKKLSSMLDSSFKAFGMKSNLADYAKQEDTKRATRLAEKALKDKEKAALKLNGTMKDGITTDKKNNDLLGITEKTFADLTGANKNLSADMSMFNGMQLADYDNMYTKMDTTGMKTDATKDKVGQLNNVANQQLLFPNYNQDRFNAFNENINISTQQLIAFQQLANGTPAQLPTQADIAPIKQITETPKLPNNTAVDKVPTTSFKQVKVAPPVPYPEVPKESTLQSTGKKIVQGIAAGIKAVNPVIGTVLGLGLDKMMGYLPQSPAKEGPLVNLTKSGENITLQIANGITRQIPALQDAMNKATGTINLSVQKSVNDIKMLQDTANKPMLIGNMADTKSLANINKIPTVVSTPTGGWERNDFGGRLRDTVNPNVNVTIKGDTKLTRTDLNKFGKRVFESVERSMHKGM